MTNPDTEWRDRFDPALLERIETGLQRASPESVRRRFRLHKSELRDLFPDYFDDTIQPEGSGACGY